MDIRNKNGSFMTPEQILQNLFMGLSEADIQSLEKISRDDLIKFHMTTGMWIRNNYGLWCGDNPYVNLKDSYADNFPDQLSQKIIEDLYDLFHE